MQVGTELPVEQAIGLEYGEQSARHIVPLFIAENQKLGTWKDGNRFRRGGTTQRNSRGRLAEPLKTPERREMQRRVRARRQKLDETASRLPTLRARAGRLGRGELPGGLFPPAILSHCLYRPVGLLLLRLLPGLRLLLFDRRRSILGRVSGLAPLSTPPVSTPSCSCLWYFEDFDLAV